MPAKTPLPVVEGLVSQLELLEALCSVDRVRLGLRLELTLRIAKMQRLAELIRLNAVDSVEEPG